MKRGGLFFIGLISAIATIISLNIAFGSNGFYAGKYPYYNHYYRHHCYDGYERQHQREGKQTDSTTTNY